MRNWRQKDDNLMKDIRGTWQAGEGGSVSFSYSFVIIFRSLT